MAKSPQAYNQRLASALLREARQAGWMQVQVKLDPDNSVTVLASMHDQEQVDDFLGGNLRMGGK